MSKSFLTWVSSFIWAMAWRRACRSPRLPRVMSFSTIGRSSLALGKVVTICSCLISAADMLANMALRWLEVRLSLRLVLPWRISSTPYGDCASHDGQLALLAGLIMIFVAFGQIVDVLGRPVGDVHAQVKAHLRQHFLDFVERLAPEIRGAEHFGFGLLDEIADIDDVVVLQAVRR